MPQLATTQPIQLRATQHVNGTPRPSASPAHAIVPQMIVYTTIIPYRIT